MGKENLGYSTYYFLCLHRFCVKSTVRNTLGHLFADSSKHKLRSEITRATIRNHTCDELVAVAFVHRRMCAFCHLLFMVRQGQVMDNHRGALGRCHRFPHRRRFPALERASPSPHSATGISSDQDFLI